MADKPFGVILREARERQGYSLEDASKYLRIRADILSAIEHSDFDNMPARGYARNMIGAYARMLGLNAPAIIRQYIKEIDEFQLYAHDSVIDAYNEKLGFRRGGSNTAAVAGGAGGGRRSSGREGRRVGSNGSQRAGERGVSRAGGNGGQRAGVARERGAGTHGVPGVQRHASQHSSGRTQQRNPHRTAYSGTQRGSTRAAVGDNPLVRTRSMQPYGGRASKNGGPRETGNQRGLLTSVFSSNFTSKLPFLIAAIFAVVVVVFLITQIVSCATPKQTSTNTSVPITGVSDTTGQASGNSNSSAANTALSAPTSCTVTYTVDSGVEVWTEIYENDSTTASVAEVISGPTTSAYTVTGKWKINVTSTSGVKVTLDGSEVQLSADDSGYYTYTVDFAKVLNEWAQKNKQSNTDNTNANANAG